MKKGEKKGVKRIVILLIILLLLLIIFLFYGIIKSNIIGNVIIKSNSFFASSSDTITGAVAEWKFNEISWTGAAGEVKDSVGTKHLTTLNGVNIQGEGIDGRSGKFDGINDSVIGNLEMNFDAFTLSFWFNTDDTISVKRIIEHSWSSNGAVSGVFTTHLDRGILYTGLTFGDGTQTFLASSQMISVYKWHHYILIYDGSNAKVYLDGELKGTVTINKPIRKVAKNIIIGGAQGITFNGSVDQIMIFSKALNNEEVKSLYINQSSNLLVPSSPDALLVNSCRNITSSGKYELTKTLINSDIYSIGCFFINSSNTELNCNGKSIFNITQNSPGILIKDANNVSIKNCNVQMNDTSNKSRGILIVNSNNISLVNNVFNKNYIGMEISESDFNSVINNTINLNFLNGISISRSNNNLISGNNLNSNLNGLFISGNNNTIEDNEMNSNFNLGALIISGNFNRLNYNNIYRNNIDGILISFGANNYLISNNISYNSRNGILINSSEYNIIDSNTISYNLGYGLSLVLGSNYNNVTENKAGGNTFAGIYESQGNTGNLIMDNIEIFYPESCGNGEIDFDEEGIDCGGSCPVCQNNIRIIDNLDLNLGFSEPMEKEEIIRFSFNSQFYDLELSEIFENSAEFIFDVNSSFNLSLGDKVKIDINEDSVFDLELFMYSLNSSNAEIFLQLISEPTVPEEDNLYDNPEEQTTQPNQENEYSGEPYNDLEETQKTTDNGQDKISKKEKSSFLENNYTILLVFGTMILLLVIIIVIWVKTMRAD
ncbi:right-handed parallel beta-helix repeat-containing protein [Candidatus Pacearchaeota archaeon]|nr:right-handed parallel beta-helix repeat-containing protein [Candidatus Pacearchaeota archaeon]